VAPCRPDLAAPFAPFLSVPLLFFGAISWEDARFFGGRTCPLHKSLLSFPRPPSIRPPFMFPFQKGKERRCLFWPSAIGSVVGFLCRPKNGDGHTRTNLNGRLLCQKRIDKASKIMVASAARTKNPEAATPNVFSCLNRPRILFVLIGKATAKGEPTKDHHGPPVDCRRVNNAQTRKKEIDAGGHVFTGHRPSSPSSSADPPPPHSPTQLWTVRSFFRVGL
jgi:hypothetical protein